MKVFNKSRIKFIQVEIVKIYGNYGYCLMFQVFIGNFVVYLIQIGGMIVLSSFVLDIVK